MAGVDDLNQWVASLTEAVSEFLFGQVNARLKSQGITIDANQQRLENGSVIEHKLGSTEFPKDTLAHLLAGPSSSPFVGYSLLVSYLRQSGKRLNEALRMEDSEFVAMTRHEPVHRGAKRNLIDEAWEFMEDDQKRTVDQNSKCLNLISQLSQFWEREGFYDRLILARLSFVPRPAIEWGIRIMRLLQRDRPKRAHWIRRFSNPLTDLTGDPLITVTEDLRNLPPNEQRAMMTESFRLISEKSEKRILESIGIDKMADPLKQGIWRLILPPLVDYLRLLQGRLPQEKPSEERAYREASQILNARYPDLWPHSPSSVRRVKHSVAGR